MLLIVHNLPKEITPLDVRQLIQEQCGFRDVILDNLVDEGPGKRITVGLAEEEDAVILMQKLNGLHYKKCQLYVEDVRKKKPIAPSYSMLIPAGLQPQTSSWIQYPTQNTAPLLKPLNQNNMPYYMTQDSNNTNFGRPTQSTQPNTSMFNRNYQYPLNATFQTPNSNDLWEYPLTSSNTNKNQASVDPPSFKGYQNDRDKQGDRRDKTTQHNWRVNKSSPSKRHENFDNFSERETRFGDKNSKRNKLRDDPRRRDDDRSPPRGRNLFRENKDDRRDDFNSSGRSRSNLWNPHDKGTCTNERQSDREQNSVFGRQRSSFDQSERRNDQNNYEQRDCSPRENILRPRSPRDNVLKRDRPSTNVFGNTSFSSKPENTSFTKSNRSIFDKIMGSRGFGETSKVCNSNPKLDTSKSKANFPAPKRARFDPPTQHFDNKKFINPNQPTNKVTDKQKMMTRYTNWCSQSASLLAKEILKNASGSKIDGTIFKSVFKKLRECIMARLDVIMGDKMANSLPEISRAYRTKFDNRDDIAFFKAVMEKVEREKAENSDEITGPKATSEKQQHQETGKLTKGPTIPNPFYTQTANLNKEKKQQNQESLKLNKEGPSFVVNPYSTPKSQSTTKPNLAASVKQQIPLISQNVPKIPFNKYPPTTPRLPKYPSSDKKGFRKFQKTALLEFEEGFFTLEPELEKAVDEEVDRLVECYVKACEPSQNKVEDTIRNKIITSTTEEFKKIIKLDVTKRVLNVTEGLTVRILCSPKPPPKALLDAFLKRHGAISLKKSDTTRMFVANCDSYENYDRLIALQTAGLGSVTIYIKPYQLMGPVTKASKKSNKTLIKPGVEDFTKDVDETKIDLTNDLINDDPDVVLIENDASEVVVIRDELDKSNNSISDKVEDIQEINDLKAFNDDSITSKIDDSNAKIAASNIKVSSPNIEVAAPNIEVAAPNIEVAAPNIEVAAPNVKVAAPNIEVAVPNIEVAAPNIEVAAPNVEVAVPDVEVAAPNIEVLAPAIEVAAPNIKVAFSNETSDKVDDCNVRVIINEKVNTNDKVNNSDAKMNTFKEKVDNSDLRVNDSIEKVDNCDATVNKSNDNVDNSNAKVNTSNEKIAASDPKINVSNVEVEKYKANVSNDKIEDSSDDQHSQSKEIDKYEKITQSIDDILNDASEILDDDLEDF